MEFDDLSPSVQNRTAFRSPLLRSELPVGSFWIHEPDVKFSESPLGPSPYVVLLQDGVSIINVSAVGALVRVVTRPNIGLLRLISQANDDPDSQNRSVPPFRDMTLTTRLDTRRDLHDILITAGIVRITLIRTGAEFSEYELAVRFYNWASVTGAALQWRKVRGDSGIPPISAWITKRQLSQYR